MDVNKKTMMTRVITTILLMIFTITGFLHNGFEGFLIGLALGTFVLMFILLFIETIIVDDERGE